MNIYKLESTCLTMQRYRNPKFCIRNHARQNKHPRSQPKRARPALRAQPQLTIRQKNPSAAKRLPDGWSGARRTSANRHPATHEHATPQGYETSYSRRALLTGMTDWDIQYAANGSPPKKTGNGGRGILRNAAAIRPKLLEKSDLAKI